MRLIEASSLPFGGDPGTLPVERPATLQHRVDVCDRHAGIGDRVAVHVENAQGVERTFTFADLKRLSDRFANALAGLGVRRGDRVGVILPQRIETVVAHVAIYKLGAVALPLSVLFGPDALAFRLADSGARALVTDAGRRDLIESIRPDLDDLRHVIPCDGEPGGFWDLVDAASESFTPADTGAGDPALLIYTSGTTGPPKGALNAHRCLLGNLPGFELSHDFFPRDGDLMWTPADWAWTGGLLDALAPALRYGVPVLGYEGGKFDPERAFALMAKYRVRNGLHPAHRAEAHDAGAGRDRPLPGVDALDHVRRRAGRRGGGALGPRGAGGDGQRDVGPDGGQLPRRQLRRGHGGAARLDGQALSGHTVGVIDDAGHPVADGAVGELAPRRGDPVMFLGYWGREEATREKFTGRLVPHRDLGYRDSDGYFWFMGRKDDVISSAGHRVGPGEIEDCLLKHPAVRQAAVVGVPDELRGQRIKAFIVLAPGTPGPTPSSRTSGTACAPASPRTSIRARSNSSTRCP